MEYFAYNPGYLTCGACGYSMGPPPRLTTSLFRLQVVCMNPSCANYRKIMNVGDEHKVSLIDTGNMVPEPRNEPANNETVNVQDLLGAGGHLGGTPTIR